MVLFGNKWRFLRFLVQKGDKNTVIAALALLLFLNYKIMAPPCHHRFFNVFSMYFQYISKCFWWFLCVFDVFSMSFRYISTYFYLIRVSFALYVLSWLFLQFCLFYGLLCLFLTILPRFWLKIAFFSRLFLIFTHTLVIWCAF